MDIETKLFRRKKISAFVEIATDMCGNIKEKPSQICSYVLVRVEEDNSEEGCKFLGRICIRKSHGPIPVIEDKE